MSKRAASFCKRIGAALLGQDCALCAAPSGTELLCRACGADLPWLGPEHCPVCARPTPGGAVCGACLRRPPHFDVTHAALAYAYPADRVVLAFKYGHRLALGDWLAQALARTGAPAGLDLILPMPLHPHRLAERGFNQAGEIGRRLAQHWRVAFDAHAAERIADTPPQAALPWRARRRNVRGAFLCRIDPAGRHLAVVDDVMTSGATLDELARTLKARGAAAVTNLVVARASGPVRTG